MSSLDVKQAYYKSIIVSNLLSIDGMSTGFMHRNLNWEENNIAMLDIKNTLSSMEIPSCDNDEVLYHFYRETLDVFLKPLQSYFHIDIEEKEDNFIKFIQVNLTERDEVTHMYKELSKIRSKRGLRNYIDSSPDYYKVTNFTPNRLSARMDSRSDGDIAHNQGSIYYGSIIHDKYVGVTFPYSQIRRLDLNEKPKSPRDPYYSFFNSVVKNHLGFSYTNHSQLYSMAITVFSLLAEMEKLTIAFNTATSLRDEYYAFVNSEITSAINNISKEQLVNIFNNIIIPKANLNYTYQKILEERNIPVYVKDYSLEDIIYIGQKVSVHTDNIDDELYTIKPITHESEESCVGTGHVTSIEGNTYIVENHIKTLACEDSFISMIPEKLVSIKEEIHANTSSVTNVINENHTNSVSTQLFKKALLEKIQNNDVGENDIVDYYINFDEYLQKINKLKDKILEENIAG